MAVEVEAGAYMNQISTAFSHNPLHDIESLWWVGIWFLLCHYQPSKLEDSTVQKHIKVVKEFGETLFNNHNSPLSRRRALIGSAIFANTKPHSFPQGVKYLIVMLDDFREQLFTYYKSYKPKESQNRSFFIPDVYHKLGNIVEGAMKELRNDQSGLWPLEDIEERITYLNTQK